MAFALAVPGVSTDLSEVGCKEVIESHQTEHDGCNQHCDGPRQWDVFVPQLDGTGYGYEYSLSEDGCKAVEGASDTDECCLVALLQCQHIEAVGGNIVRGGGKCCNDEQNQCDGEHADGSCPGSYRCFIRFRNGQRQQNECYRHQDLHGDDPPSFGLDNVDERAPEGLDGPGQIQQTRKQGHLSIGNTHLGKHQYRDVVDNEVGDALCKV